MRKEKERWRVRIYWGRKKEGKKLGEAFREEEIQRSYGHVYTCT